MKKARAWLDDRGVAYAFHDYKTEGVDKALLERWAKDVGWEICSTAPARVPQGAGEGAGDVTEKKAIALMLEQPR